jgi:hypothetical protein
MPPDRSEFPIEEPEAALERAFIDDYLKTHGHDPRALRMLPEEQVRTILREAVQYAAARLAELEARAHYVNELHGALPPSIKSPKHEH